MTKFEYDMFKDYEKFDNKTSKAAKGGVNFLELLLLLFIGLKLAKIINWSWWWVFSPVWIPASLVIIMIVIIIVIDAIKKTK